MKTLLLLSVLALVTLGGERSGQTRQAASEAQAADPGITAYGVIGVISVIDAVAKQLIIKTDAGALVTVALSDKTNYLRLPPGEQSLMNATRIAFSDLAQGDRVWARGRLAKDHKSVPALSLVVMSKADIAKKQEQERLEWSQRGILGVISTLKPDLREVTISTRNAMGPQVFIIQISDKLDMRRYAPDSIKFSEAKPGTFDQLKVGDQVRALGERSAEGTRFIPEKVVTGSFQTIAGIVTGVDAAAGEIRINHLQTRQPLTIVVKADSVLRKFSPEMGGVVTAARGPGASAPAGVVAPSSAGGARSGGATGGVPNIQEILERLPTISTADVKVGDTIVVSSTKGSDPSRLTAITLVSGADALLAILAPRPQPGAGQAVPNPAAGLGSGTSFGIGLP